MLWDIKGQSGLFADAVYEADAHHQEARLHRFAAGDRIARLTPARTTIETAAGDVLEARDNPRDAIKDHDAHTRWDKLNAVYIQATPCGPI